MDEPKTGASSLASGSRTDTPPAFETTKHLAQAEAAFALIECLMLVFVERGLFTADELVSEIETAIEAERQMIKDGLHPELSAMASVTLVSIANSVAAADFPQSRAPPPHASVRGSAT